MSMERRSDTTSTIFCTQYRKDDWIKRLGNGVQEEAIVDRYALAPFYNTSAIMLVSGFLTDILLR